MKEQFHISTQEPFQTDDCCLAIQLGSDYFCYSISDLDKCNLVELKRYRYNAITTDILDAILKENVILQNGFPKIVTALDFGFSSLLPIELGQKDSMPLMYIENADQQEHVITEHIEEHGIANMYSVPSPILTWLLTHFPSSTFLHAHTVTLNAIKEVLHDGLLRIDFSDHKFTVVAVKNETVLLVKTYTYHSPSDVAFYLLKIAEVFGFLQNKVAVQVSGLIDVDSKLFREIYDYFLHVTVKSADWGESNSEIAQHYFTALNELTLCELSQEA